MKMFATRRTCQLQTLEARQLLSGTPIGSEFLVNTTTSLDQFAPAVARDYVGNFVVVWTSEEQTGGSNEPTNHDVYARVYDFAGAPITGQFKVNQFTTGIQARPSVAMDKDGDFVVAWQSGTSDSLIFPGQDGSGSGVWARRFNALGVAQGNEFRVNTVTANDQDAPSVATDDNGNFLVAWNSNLQDGSGWGVYAQRYNSAAAPQGGEFRVNTFTTDTQQDPSVAMDADGDFVVAWTSGNQGAGQDGSFYGVYAKRFNAAGVVQGSEFKANAFTTDYQTDPSVAMDRNGNFVIAWNSFGQDGSEYGIYAQRYNSAGAVQGAEFRANSFTAGNQSDPRVDMNLVGDFVIVWGSDAQDLSGRGVYGQFYNANGTTSGGEFRANAFVNNNQNRPAVAMDANGNFVVAFQDGSTVPNVPGQDGSGYGVYARRYVTQDRIPPTVARSVFNFLTGQNLQVTFTQNVGASLTTADIQLQNLTTGQFVPAGSMSVSFNATTNTATITFPGFASGILPDGNYRLTLLSSGITNGAGQQLDADRNGTGGDNFTFDFFVLAGDANRDKRVNLADFNILAANFGQSPRDFSQGDFNYDSIVNLADFNLLASRFGTVLPAPVPATAPPSGTSRIADDVLG